MSTTYFLTFLLALAALSTANTAMLSGDEPRKIPSTRFHSRLIEKSPDDVANQRAKLKHTGARRTMEGEMEKTIDQDRTVVGSRSEAGALMNNDLENINGRAMRKARPEYFGSGSNRKTATAESEEGVARKPAGYRGKEIGSRMYDENMY
ncbi:hypothetical protein CASFOL_005190 [Castilleja foliolosa]|uniref:Uncharacterized protein n=1 Tax=Castilleja foliolosa TaxID=1961234 RepID=A0ABD3E4S1_9LAMI